MKTKILLSAFLLCAILFSYGQSTSTTASGKPNRINIPDNIRSRKAYQRAEWFYTQRAFPYDTIPAFLYLKEKDREIQKAISFRMKSSYSVTWEPLGPKGVNTTVVNWGTVSGRVKAIAVHPNDPLTVYIGAAGGGLWKTTDGGENWLDIGHSLPSQTYGAIAIDPNNPDIIYAGSGEAILGAFYCYPGNGLYKSTDGGQTWSVITNGFGPVTYFSDLLVSPFNSNVVIAEIRALRQLLPDVAQIQLSINNLRQTQQIFRQAMTNQITTLSNDAITRLQNLENTISNIINCNLFGINNF